MEELREISQVSIDADAALPLRLRRYMQDIVTPDRFMCGELIVNLRYGDRSLQDSIQKLVSQSL